MKTYQKPQLKAIKYNAFIAKCLNYFTGFDIYTPSIQGIRVNLASGGHTISIQKAIQQLSIRVKVTESAIGLAKTGIKCFVEKQVTNALEGVNKAQEDGVM